ncbi:hypothetical protein SNEBB_003295 [Seison nebaliae]|nr:hypothetical protein SNEBB_003295 [Seison nebaliae]
MNFLLIGDSYVGKHTFLESINAEKQLHSDNTYLLTVHKIEKDNVKKKIRTIQFELKENLNKYDRIYEQFHPQNRCILLMFNIENHETLQSIQYKWIPLIRYCYPSNVHVILLGMKSDKELFSFKSFTPSKYGDQTDDDFEDFLERLTNENYEKEIKYYCEENQFVSFIQCSTKNGENIKFLQNLFILLNEFGENYFGSDESIQYLIENLITLNKHDKNVSIESLRHIVDESSDMMLQKKIISNQPSKSTNEKLGEIPGQLELVEERKSYLTTNFLKILCGCGRGNRRKINEEQLLFDKKIILSDASSTEDDDDDSYYEKMGSIK